jgi:hypothetical protein
LLAEWVDRFGLKLHAYVLMPNHYHLLAETTEANLSQAMQWLNLAYTVWFNRRHQRVGHLFQGRFKSVIVEPETWALGLSRYIHLNPVRVRRLALDRAARRQQRQGLSGQPTARVVQQRLKLLRSYRWSSYRAYAGYAKRPEWLCCGSVLAFGGGRAKQRVQDYRCYVEQGVGEGYADRPWEALVGQAVLGSGDFIEKLMHRARGTRAEKFAQKRLASRPSFGQVVGVVEKLKGAPWSAFRDQHKDWGRDLAVYLGRRRCGLTLGQLATAIDAASAGTVSVAVRRFARRLETDRRLRVLVEKAEAKLSNVQS